jgi:hypothetical protein
MATNHDSDGKDGKRFTDAPEPADDATRRRPAIDPDADDTEGHLYGGGPSTQGEAFPHPAGNPDRDR